MSSRYPTVAAFVSSLACAALLIACGGPTAGASDPGAQGAASAKEGSDAGAGASAPSSAAADAAPPQRPFAGSAAEATQLIGAAVDKNAAAVQKCVSEYRTRKNLPHERVTITMGIDQEGRLLGATAPEGEERHAALGLHHGGAGQRAVSAQPFGRHLDHEELRGARSVTMLPPSPSPRSRMGGAAALVATLLLAAVLARAACGGAPIKLTGVTRPTPSGPSSTWRRKPVVGHVLGTIPERTIGPFFARVPNRGGVAAWVTPAEGSARRVVALPLTAVGEPRGAAKTIANVPVDTTTLVVRPTRGASPGIALAWTVLTDRGEALWTVVVGEDGAPRAKPVELSRTSDDVVWVDVIPTDSAARSWCGPRRREAEMQTSSLRRSIRTERSAARRPHRARRRRMARPRASARRRDSSTVVTPKDAKGGALSFQRLDADGRAVAPPTPIVAAPVVSGDVEVVRAAGRLVFAWTDRTSDDPSVAAAASSDDGKVEPAHKLVEARGGATLLGLASGAAGTAIVVAGARALAGRHAPRVILHAYRRASRSKGARPPWRSSARVAPEMVATETGFAILAALKDCDAGSPRCPDAPVVPTMVRTDARLVPVQREPFGFGTDPASMAWGMTCDRDLCMALAASGASPARVRAADVHARVNMKPPPDVAAPDVDAPKVTDVTVIATGESVVDLAATRIGDVTGARDAVGQAPGGRAPSEGPARGRAQRADVLHALIDVTGNASVAVRDQDARARGRRRRDRDRRKARRRRRVAWVARDNGDPEVHVTRIDKKGERERRPAHDDEGRRERRHDRVGRRRVDRRLGRRTRRQRRGLRDASVDPTSRGSRAKTDHERTRRRERPRRARARRRACGSPGPTRARARRTGSPTSSCRRSA